MGQLQLQIGHSVHCPLVRILSLRSTEEGKERMSWRNDRAELRTDCNL
jgi:hypothetical protein